MDGAVGFIGLGMMGAPMAANLVAKGTPLLTHDAANVGIPGAEALPGAAELASRAGTIILMLPDSPAVASVLGALEGAMRPGTVVVDMGSSLPAATREWGGRLAARGCAMVDAPVSGSVVKARAGTLAIMAGGAPSDVDRVEPLLRRMGEAIIRTGALGSAHAMKALNNYVYAAGLLAVSEAALMAEREGLDLGILTQVLNASSGRNIASETKLGQEIASRRYAGGFQLGLMRKDIETAAGIAEATGVEARLLRLLREEWAEAVAAQGPKSDNTAIHKHLIERERP
ncbi:NAD(P)-dependent oxidoreductase [Sabulicella glaciei]|uniref:NAD(P)-dependent oxidoreductase n=1 Tax=Sabulicella glaciei TaxID=2984948 RepID=A0ABT3NQN8_9PROT|nr:NAD(P)-dependent oxidoreductase [Roseococcus sp. MDT2-1-1]MCW8084472.1 NAD(P)-dependent oxidoreductase [Roseococcus sp. MDT2-1-1]